VIPQQRPGDRQAEEFGVAELGSAARSLPRAEQVIDHDIECGDEVVETGVHVASQGVDVVQATPNLGGLVCAVTPGQPRPNTASVI
jgi:hypothetical protein